MRARLVAVELLLLGCSTAPAPLLQPPATPLVVAAAPRHEPPAPLPTSEAAAPGQSQSPNGPPSSSPEVTSASTSTSTGTSGEAHAPAPLVLIEPPYSPLGHPRLATEMLTLGREDELFHWALGGSSAPEHPSNRPGYHPATRVVVDVQLLSRAPKGSTARLLRLARSSGYWPLRACFEAAQRSLAKPERSARVRLTLGATGKVLGARNVGPTPERDYARCVLDRVRSLDFRPGFTRKLDVEVSVKQWPGHAPVPPRAPDGTPPLRLPEAAMAALLELQQPFAACYAQGLARDPRLWGRIALHLRLAKDGAVEEATPVETVFPDAEVADCARRAVMQARIPSATVSELTVAARFGQGLPPAPGAPAASEPAPPAPEPPAPVSVH